jgi:alkanesulfonate monooxygenase SsuD/methylene tetrahydromethanopterin reductase-like flavin-dependent oxidoreductase (luciferase family)
VGLVLPMFLADDEETALREAREPMMRSYANLVVPQESINDEAVKDRLRGGGFHFYAGGFLNQMKEYTFESVLQNDIAFAGTPKQFIAWLARFREKYYDFQELSLMADFGGQPEWQVSRTLQLFARDVMPALR